MGPQIKGAFSKKRKLNSRVEEITFDDTAREQFLTGFRRRKQQRIKHAQEVAAQKAREAKREDRKRMREERNADFERALEEHKRQMKRMKEENESGDDSDNASSGDGEEDEWDGIAEPPAVDYEAEYVDEDKYTTVTVEEMDPSKEGLLQSDDDSSDERTTERPASTQDAKPVKPEKTKKQSDNKLKKKKKKFRYESKEERKVTRMKERASNHRKAKARKER
ncbi:nucleolar protein 12-domain-containing protein [Aspergillus karnatakaensis]|uniref:rRNA-processing protein RRP17 n=1 Tax=Aspergillus karnatakaensis TaxID=1810916 RepID=UPI003CCD3DAA